MCCWIQPRMSLKPPFNFQITLMKERESVYMCICCVSESTTTLCLCLHIFLCICSVYNIYMTIYISPVSVPQLPFCATWDGWSSSSLHTLSLVLTPLWKYTFSHSNLPSFSTQYEYVNFWFLGRSSTITWPLYRFPQSPLFLNQIIT